jgi:hypothetical protein
LILILSSLHVYSQNETNYCKGIYGKWETYCIQEPFGIDSKDKSETWIFNEDGTLKIDGKTTKYSLEEEDCSKLIIEGVRNFFSIEILKDTLFMTKRILMHESYNLLLKRIN